MEGTRKNLLITPSSTNSFLDSDLVTSPALRYDEDTDTFEVWYHGKQKSVQGVRIFHAVSVDAVTWVKTAADSTPGPDAILSPLDLWEGTSIRSPSWLENPELLGDPFEFWYTGNQLSIGYATGNSVSWTRGETNPVLTADSASKRFDGLSVHGHSVRYDPVASAYHMYYAV